MIESNCLCVFKFNKTCLYCIHWESEYWLTCDHSLCDNCTMLYEQSINDMKYRFIISLCLRCLSRVSFIIDFLSLTMRLIIVAIDNDDMHDEILIEFLMLMQKSLKSQCFFQDFVNLVMRISFNELILIVM